MWPLKNQKLKKIRIYTYSIFFYFVLFYFILFYFLRFIDHSLGIKLAINDVQQRLKLIEIFYSREWSIIETQRKYQEYFNVKISSWR